MAARLAVVIMGVAGAGKSHIGKAVASRLGIRFIEGDDVHPTANRDRMNAGIPLTDADRAPWLSELASQLRTARERGESVIMSCSALRRVYRDRLRDGDASVRFVFLNAAAETLHHRLLTRPAHYMGAEMLASQLTTLEPPVPEEAALVVDASLDAARLVERIVSHVSSAAPGARA